MPTNFPTALDTNVELGGNFINTGVVTDAFRQIDATYRNNSNDAMFATQTRIGIDNSLVTTSLSWATLSVAAGNNRGLRFAGNSATWSGTQLESGIFLDSGKSLPAFHRGGEVVGTFYTWDLQGMWEAGDTITFGATDELVLTTGGTDHTATNGVVDAVFDVGVNNFTGYNTLVQNTTPVADLQFTAFETKIDNDGNLLDTQVISCYSSEIDMSGDGPLGIGSAWGVDYRAKQPTFTGANNYYSVGLQIEGSALNAHDYAIISEGGSSEYTMGAADAVLFAGIGTAHTNAAGVVQISALTGVNDMKTMDIYVHNTTNDWKFGAVDAYADNDGDLTTPGDIFYAYGACTEMHGAGTAGNPSFGVDFYAKAPAAGIPNYAAVGLYIEDDHDYAVISEGGSQDLTLGAAESIIINAPAHTDAAGVFQIEALVGVDDMRTANVYVHNTTNDWEFGAVDAHADNDGDLTTPGEIFYAYGAYTEMHGTATAGNPSFGVDFYAKTPAAGIPNYAAVGLYIEDDHDYGVYSLTGVNYFTGANDVAAPIIHINQADVDEPFIQYEGTQFNDATKNISTLIGGMIGVTGPDASHWTFVGLYRIQVEGGGSISGDYWVPFFQAV